jgi:adenylate kinase
MRVAVTGTPGVGKTTATERLAADSEIDLEVVNVNEVIESEPALTVERDEERDSMVVDITALREHFADAEDVLFESHLAHHIDTDRTVVLRCPPATVEERLVERGEPRESAQENAESEALDIVLTEAVERAGRDSVYEIDTTDLDPSAVADAIREVVASQREPSAGTVSFTGYL